jgi:hypothetical protein
MTGLGPPARDVTTRGRGFGLALLGIPEANEGTAVTVEPTAKHVADHPTQYLLWVDGVGGYLVCLSHRVTLGQANPESAVDIALQADVSRHHATIQRDPEGYFLEAVRKVQVNGQTTEKALLRSADRVTLGGSCQLQFWQPVPVSTSARLDLVSGHRFVQPVQAALLMADTLVLGPDSQSHVQVPDLTQPVILYRNKKALAVRWAGPMQIAGQTHEGRGPLEPGATVCAEQFSFALDPVVQPRR